ncbi:MAG: strawberry notch family protein, partial [Bacteroidota bacterium]
TSDAIVDELERTGVTAASFDDFGDPAHRGRGTGVSRSYIRAAGVSVEAIAERAGQYTDENVQPADVIDFILAYQDGVQSYRRATVPAEMQQLARRYDELGAGDLLDALDERARQATPQAQEIDAATDPFGGAPIEDLVGQPVEQVVAEQPEVEQSNQQAANTSDATPQEVLPPGLPEQAPPPIRPVEPTPSGRNGDVEEGRLDADPSEDGDANTDLRAELEPAPAVSTATEEAPEADNGREQGLAAQKTRDEPRWEAMGATPKADRVEKRGYEWVFADEVPLTEAKRQILIGILAGDVDRIVAKGLSIRKVETEEAEQIEAEQIEAEQIEAEQIEAEEAERIEASETDKLVSVSSLGFIQFVTGQQTETAPLSEREMLASAGLVFGGTVEEGAFEPKDAYDAIERGVNQGILESGYSPTVGRATAAEIIKVLERITATLPRQRRRSIEMDQFQQFSTPPAYAYLAAWVASLDQADIVFEPSAGVGGLVAWAAAANVRAIHANELSNRRASLIETLTKTNGNPAAIVTRENADHAYALFHKTTRPSVVLMNPPFSNTAGRTKKKQSNLDLDHVEQAYKLLEDDGRLVAIVGGGLAGFEQERAARIAREAKKRGLPLVASVGIPGKVYSRYGTSFNTRLLVFDKTVDARALPTVTASAESLIDALRILEPIQATRTIFNDEAFLLRSALEQDATQPAVATNEQPPAQPASPSTLEPGRDRAESESAARADADAARPAAPAAEQPAAEPGDPGAAVPLDLFSASARPDGARSDDAPGPEGRDRDAGTQERGVGARSSVVDAGRPDTSGRSRDALGSSDGQGRRGGSRLPDPVVEANPKAVAALTKIGGAALVEAFEAAGFVPVYEAQLQDAGVVGDSDAWRATLLDYHGGDQTFADQHTRNIRNKGITLYRPTEPSTATEPSKVPSRAREARPVSHRPSPRGDRTGSLTESVFDSYQPSIIVDGGQTHPTKLVESATMASVDTPPVRYQPTLPLAVVQEGRLSTAQIEAIALAGQSHNQILPASQDAAPRRRGFFIGDGTGVGKGREAAGIFLDNWLQGRRKGLWVSKNANKLFRAAVGDWTDLGQEGNNLFNVSDQKGAIDRPDGIAFVSYGTLKAEPRTKDGDVRIEQIIEYLLRREDGTKMKPEEFDGVILFDEAHMMANAVASKGTRGTKKASITAQKGIELQERLPNARVVYMSATGATEVHNLAYAERLGLWGKGTPFASVEGFITEITAGGIAAMELISKEMKSMGVYLARSLSYEDVQYEALPHPLTAPQREIFDTLAGAWQVVLQNIGEALKLTGGEKNGMAKGQALGQFWGAHQRFFNQIITSFKAPTLIRSIEGDLQDDKSVLVQIISTNDAQTKRAVAKLRAEGTPLDDLDITPREQLMDFVEASFPVAQFQEEQDDLGNIKSVMVTDSNGNPVENPDAVALREELLIKLGSVQAPLGLLDQLVEHFGPDAVTEVTGRSRRFVRQEDPETGQTYVREDALTPTAEKADIKAYMGGKKRILVFSQAGGTGSSYHASRTAKNQQQRVHYLAEPGWRADVAVQGFGRSHRSNQRVAPIFRLLMTDVEGEKRFVSSIARRLAQLGALTKGQRETGSTGVVSAEMNLETTFAQNAVTAFFRDLYRGNVPGLLFSDVEAQMGLDLIDPQSGTLSRTKIPDIRKFLNRLLSLRLETQNAVFSAWSEYHDAILERAREDGQLDVGMETITGLDVREVANDQVMRDREQGTETRLVSFEVDQPLSTRSWTQMQELEAHERERGTWAGYVRNKRSGRIYATYRGPSESDPETGAITPRFYVMDVNDRRKLQASDTFTPDRYDTLTAAKAQPLWEAEHRDAPTFETEQLHLVTGSLLKIWDRIPAGKNRQGKPITRIVRVKTGKQDDEGTVYLGRAIPDDAVDRFRTSLGLNSKISLTADQALDRVMQGDTLVLSNGWRIARRRVGGVDRSELLNVTGLGVMGELKRDGVLVERIDYKTRYFIPTGDAGAAVFESVTEFRPVVERIRAKKGGGSRYASQGDFDESAGSTPRGGIGPAQQSV